MRAPKDNHSFRSLRAAAIAVAALFFTSSRDARAQSHEIAFNLHDPIATENVVADGASLRDDPVSSGVKYWIPDRAAHWATVTYRFDAPFTITGAHILARIETYPRFDAGARAVLQVSSDGDHWTELCTLPDGDRSRFDSLIEVDEQLRGAKTVYIRARLLSAATHSSGQSFFAQFMRTGNPGSKSGRIPVMVIKLRSSDVTDDAIVRKTNHQVALAAAEWSLKAAVLQRVLPDGFTLPTTMESYQSRADQHATRYIELTGQTTWKDYSGNHSFEAAYQGHDSNNVFLARGKTDAEPKAIPLWRLSDESLSRIDAINSAAIRVIRSANAVAPLLHNTPAARDEPFRLTESFDGTVCDRLWRMADGAEFAAGLASVKKVAGQATFVFRSADGSDREITRDVLNDQGRRVIAAVERVADLHASFRRETRDFADGSDEWAEITARLTRDYDWLDSPQYEAEKTLLEKHIEKLQQAIDLANDKYEKEAAARMVLATGVMGTLESNPRHGRRDAFLREYKREITAILDRSVWAGGFVRDGGGVGVHPSRIDWWAAYTNNAL